MDLTQGTEEEKRRRSKKMMLWFAIISMAMMFAGLTSAYVVSRNREDWMKDLEMPQAFIWSTIAILISSFTFHFAKKAILKNNRSLATSLLLTTFGLAIVFVVLQFSGFQEFIDEGLYPAGSASNINVSFNYLIIFSHLLHLAAGLITLLVVIYNHFKQRYKSGQMLGIELGATFWHFVDILWIYLFLFLYFFR
ncbi:cytochrome c oxidase subunit 3 [Mesonia aquimarina]|uniref:cytochrome c oxidase subunit 3 n=1 Tax=Mesonia aquimarina TaxID=1504967 RepID=UPI000EF56908|nr:cytochrome c oxidase subunit 3 [Mesonia aquimarina]